MAKAEHDRIRRSLERQALRLKTEQLALDRLRRQLSNDRADALVMIKLLADQHGLPAADLTRPLAELIDEVLAVPLLARLREAEEAVRDLQTRVAALALKAVAPAPPVRELPPPAPVPLRDLPPPPARVSQYASAPLRPAGQKGESRDAPPREAAPAHALEIQTWGTGGAISYRAVCSCTWGGTYLKEAYGAEVEAERHAAISRAVAPGTVARQNGRRA